MEKFDVDFGLVHSPNLFGWFRKGQEMQSSEGLAVIDDKLEQLRRYETDRYSSEVAAAIEAMRTVIAPHLSWLQDKGIVVTYHGSLQYNDPRHLDIDMDLVNQDTLNTDRELQDKLTRFDDELTAPGILPRSNSTTNFSIITIDDIKRRVKKKGNNPYEPDNDSWSLAFNASLVLSSKMLFDNNKQRSLSRKYQEEIRKLARDNSYIRDGIIYLVDETIAVRESRR